MDQAVVSTVGFEQAAQSLRRLRRPSFAQVYGSLGSARTSLDAARILRELAPEKLAACRLTGAKLLDDDLQDSLLRETVEEISRVAPLDDNVEMDLEDGYVRLIPAPMGYPMNWDEWHEIAAEPENYLSDDAAPWAFYEALLQTDEEAFTRFSDYWDWELSYPRRGGEDLDWKKMFKILDKRGWSCFKAAFNIACFDTGNLYFDYNVYEDNIPLPNFSIEGVRKLQADYQTARIIQAEYLAAVQLFNEPEVPGELLKIYKRCLVKDKRKPERSNLLIDILGRANEAGINPGTTAIDDFENDETDPLGVLDGHADQGLATIARQIREIGEQIEEINDELRIQLRN